MLDPDEVTVTLAAPVEIESGRDGRGELLVANRTDVSLEIRTNGHVTATVVDPESGALVGGFAGAQTMPLIVFRAEAGATVGVPLLIGTASFTPSLGYSVPPGRWALEVRLDLGERGVCRAPWLPLSVTSPRSVTS